jgi:membrane protease YdiL (CAAX protease family)
MKTIKTFIQQHPLLTYYALTFTISWGGSLWVLGGLGKIPIPPEEIARVFLPAYLATVAGPSMVCILMTGLLGGREGLRDLFSRLIKWRAGVRWYAIAVVSGPLSVVGTLLVLSLFSREFLPGFLTPTGSASSPGALAFPLGVVVALSLFNGFVEELGWTGFAIPRMNPRYGVFVTGLSVGLLWGAWHFVSNLALSGGSTGLVPLAPFMAGLLFSFLPPFRVLMVWVYDHTHSLLVAMLMHSSLNIFWLLSTPVGIGPVSLMTWYVSWAVLLWVIVAAVLRLKTLPLPARGVAPARISDQKGASS